MTNTRIFMAPLMVIAFIASIISTLLFNVVYAEPSVMSGVHTSSDSTLQGKVTEIINVTGYTYAEVNLGKKKVWVAGPVTALKLNDDVSFSTTMPMKKFHSKTLKRDFDIVYFVGTFNANTDSMSKHPGAMPSPHAQLKNTDVNTPVNDIDKVKGGYTIAEINANKNNLDGKVFEVRGKVTKVTKNVMGNNWVHIRDSSTLDDLTLSTKDIANIDEVVIVKGKLALDQDYSYGYIYPVILLESKIRKE